jgi:diguanylate cyclase (GGDEF)-like protein
MGGELVAILGDQAQAFAQAIGCRLTCVATGVEGLRELLNHRQAVVLVSAQLPDISAAALLEQIPRLAPDTAIATTLSPSAAHAPTPDATRHRLLWLKPPVSAVALQGTLIRLVHEAAAVISALPTRLMHSLNHIEDIIVDPSRAENALGSICLELRKLAGADAIALFLPATTEPVLLLTSVDPLSAAHQQQLTHAAAQSYAALVRQPVPYTQAPQLCITSDQPALRPAPPYVATVSVPLLTEHQIKGVLCAAYTTADARARCPTAMLFHLANHAVLIYQEVSRARNMAARDVLTGLYNRSMFAEALKQTFSLAVRKGAPIALLLFDVDNLKSINDQHGHLAGDMVLREAANLTLATARTSDIVARFGGDEFAVILPETALPDAQRAAERLLSAFRERRFDASGQHLRVSLSIGVAAVTPPHDFNSQTLLALADEGLLVAKRTGKDRYCLAPSLAEETSATPLPPAAPTDSRRALILDDDASVRQILGKMLHMLNFEITACSDLPEALQAIEASPDDFDMVLTDLNLGTGTGIDLLQALKNKAPWTIKMVVSAYASKATAIECLRHGAFDFIEKPFSFSQLEAAINRGMEHRQLLVANRRYQTQLEQLVRSRSESLAHALETLRRSYSQTIQTLALMIDAREVNTGLHCRMAREAVRLLARQMNLSNHDFETMEMGAVLHDIGKLGIPDAVLQKPGPLTPDEQQIMRRHPQIGYDLLAGVPFLHEVAEIVLQHHECFDGSGYPARKKGDEICLGARIFAVIDAYHAMRSSRCYRAALSEEIACCEIIRCAGQQFDPAVVTSFLACRAEIEAAFAAVPSSP